MSKKYQTMKAIILAITLLAFGGCQSGKQQGQVLIDDADTGDLTGGFQSFTEVLHLYPSPGEMLSVIDMTEVSYDGDLLVEARHADRYQDLDTKTYMLGVYMTDLAYTALFGRHEATLVYLETIRDLSEDIRIYSAVSEDMINSAQRHVDMLDSLYIISNEAFMNILSYCERNDRANTVVMLSAGAFTESLFLAINLVNDYAEADYLIQHLADQKLTINNFMRFAEAVVEDDPSLESIIQDLRTIQVIYDGIDSGTGSVTINRSAQEDDEAPKIVIGSSGENSQASLTQEEFEKLKSAIVELRTKMIQE